MNVEKVTPESHDVLDCARDLIEAFAQPEISAFRGNQPVTPETSRAALWLAVALGRCRLFGVALGQQDGVLPPRMALAAAEECSRQLRHRADKALALAQEFDEEAMLPAQEEVDGDFDTALEVGNFLFVCMDLWAALVAIDEAYHGCVATGDDTGAALRRAISQTVTDSEALDQAMQENTDVFCIAADTSLLDNWRYLLVEPYRTQVPWWLHGSLETANQCRKLREAGRKEYEFRASEQEAAQQRDRSIRKPVLRILEETMEDLGRAFRRKFRPEAMLALAAACDEKNEVQVLWDSKLDLAPLRCIVYREPNGDLRLDFSSTDDTHENQTFEVVIKEQMRPTVTFRRDPETGELYGEARIPRDELPEADLSKLTFRLKKS